MLVPRPQAEANDYPAVGQDVPAIGPGQQLPAVHGEADWNRRQRQKVSKGENRADPQAHWRRAAPPIGRPRSRQLLARQLCRALQRYSGGMTPAIGSLMHTT